MRVTGHDGKAQQHLIGILPDRGIGIVVLWNSESSAPTGLLPSLMDRALDLPHEDWVGAEDTSEE